jgi:hypothetical protein
MAASPSVGSENLPGTEGVRTTAAKPAASPPVDWSWKAILERCRKVAGAHAIISVDADGLPVAWSGLTDQVEASRIAAHVGKAFDLLDRLKYVGRFAECLCTMYWPEGTWLTAVRIAPNVSTVVTVAVVGPYTLVDQGRRRLRNTFLRLLEDDWPTA